MDTRRTLSNRSFNIYLVRNGRALESLPDCTSEFPQSTQQNNSRTESSSSDLASITNVLPTYKMTTTTFSRKRRFMPSETSQWVKSSLSVTSASVSLELKGKFGYRTGASHVLAPFAKIHQQAMYRSASVLSWSVWEPIYPYWNMLRRKEIACR